ncbi:MAG: glutathione S-transferase N-terminal domain-containing protein [Xanthomonadales bacterium]|jgi:glutathione S-transferase|nr:glutathione S-transferase N-terminal domain-containing protein [Xanthomonadales bacterium]
MTAKRLFLHSLFLLLLPLAVAFFGISPGGAAALVILALLWRWAISLSLLVAPPQAPALELETISASHFVEKVRWCMDRLGVDYTERPCGGTLGAFFLGRTVPLLNFRTGAVRSRIGNSPEILRYLWGRYAAEMPEQACFLEPTPERMEFEKKIDRCGVDLQVWVYYHVLDNRDLTLHAWGVSNPEIPAWQRSVLKLAFPLLRFLIRKSFRITPAHHAKAVAHITALLAEVETRLGDDRKSILGGDIINYSDIAFCAIMGLWLQPPGYGGGKADSVRIEREQYPQHMAAEVEAWRQNYPLASGYIEKLYESERLPASG